MTQESERLFHFDESLLAYSSLIKKSADKSGTSVKLFAMGIHVRNLENILEIEHCWEDRSFNFFWKKVKKPSPIKTGFSNGPYEMQHLQWEGL
jgi:hypothetical protein